MSEPQRDWLLRKGGYFYRPGSAGYTASVHEAGRYTEAEAKRHAASCSGEVTAHHISEWASPPHMSEPVDTSAVAVERAIKDQWAAAVTGWQMTVCDRTAALLRALAAERAELQRAHSEAAAHYAATFAASDAYQKRCEQGDALLREARRWLVSRTNILGRIDAHLAGEAMGAREGK